jgi:hypothetical protein
MVDKPSSVRFTASKKKDNAKKRKKRSRVLRQKRRKNNVMTIQAIAIAPDSKEFNIFIDPPK